MNLAAPVPRSAYISQKYGENPYTYGYGPLGHMGLDFGGVGIGSPVYAALPGRAMMHDTDNRGYGLSLWIDCGWVRFNGQVMGEALMIYAHLSRVLCLGSRDVITGEALGLTGNSGNSQGAHLHFELRVDGAPVDPEPWLIDHWIYRG